MKAVLLEAHGDPDHVVVVERPVPEPGPGQVRVRMAVGGFNHVDLYMISGGAGITHRLPLVLGVDGAGVIDAVGDGVSRRTPGERVVIYPIEYCGACEFCLRGDQSLCLKCRIHGEQIDGTFREYFCVPEYAAHPISDHISFEAAAMLPCAYLVAWRMIHSQARVRPGQTVLIMGIGGGVATAALQFARIAGARVLVTSSSDAKLERAREHGAEGTVNYAREDVFRRVMDLTGGRGADVVVESVGEATWGTSLRCVVRGGTIVTCGATTGPNPPADLQRVFIRQIRIQGAMLGSQEEFRAMLAALEQGRFDPIIDRIYEMDAVREGLARMRQGEQFGKLALRLGGG